MEFSSRFPLLLLAAALFGVAALSLSRHDEVNAWIRALPGLITPGVNAAAKPPLPPSDSPRLIGR